MVDEKKCITCGACIFICAVGAIKIVDNKATINPKKCIKCNSCAQFCPVGAIEIEMNDASKNNESKKSSK